MSRIEVLARRPKRTLSALAVVLLAVGVTVGTGAGFTAQSSNPSNTFATGTLTMANSVVGAVLDLTNLVPGDSSSGTVDIENTGSVSGSFTLSRSALTNSDGVNPLADQIDLVITDCGTDLDCVAGTNTDIYDGTLTGMSTTISLGTFAVNEERRYRFASTFNASAGNVYQGADTSATFQWDATE
jgi:hypothetical protein